MALADMANYSTREAAKKLGIHFITLHRYILDSKVPAPRVQSVSGVKFRVWKDRDIERVRDLLPKIANGRKTRHQKSQSAKPKAKTKKKPQPRAAVPRNLRQKKK